MSRRHSRRKPRLGEYLRERSVTTEAAPDGTADARPAATAARRIPFAFADQNEDGEPATTSPARLPRPSDPSAEELLLKDARSAALRGTPQRAAELYRQMLDLNPHDHAARLALGRVLLDSGEPLAALEELERVPDDLATRVARGTALGALGRFTQAQAALRQVLDTDPGNVDAHLELGLVLARRGRWRDAAPHFRRGVELDAGRASAYLHLGEALNHTDDLHGSLQAFQRAAELRPNNPRALRGLGIVLDRLRRPGEAAEMYRRARELAGA